MSQDSTASPTGKITALDVLRVRPPLPPAPTDGAWTWTRPKLKAVYLDALTGLDKSAIASAVGVNAKTLYRWRTHSDYRRYLAVLVYGDGLAERVERVKARKEVSSKLTKILVDKLDSPSAIVGEKLSSLLKAHREMLDSLADDVDDMEKKTDGADVGRKNPVGLEIVERVNAIGNPVEREIVKRHLSSMFRDYLDGTSSGAPTEKMLSEVIDVAPTEKTDGPDVEKTDGPTGEMEFLDVAPTEEKKLPDGADVDGPGPTSTGPDGPNGGPGRTDGPTGHGAGADGGPNGAGGIPTDGPNGPGAGANGRPDGANGADVDGAEFAPVGADGTQSTGGPSIGLEAFTDGADVNGAGA